MITFVEASNCVHLNILILYIDMVTRMTTAISGPGDVTRSLQWSKMFYVDVEFHSRMIICWLIYNAQIDLFAPNTTHSIST